MYEENKRRHPSTGYLGTNKKARQLQALKKQTNRERHTAYLAIGVLSFSGGVWLGIVLTNLGG